MCFGIYFAKQKDSKEIKLLRLYVKILLKYSRNNYKKEQIFTYVREDIATEQTIFMKSYSLWIINKLIHKQYLVHF